MDECMGAAARFARARSWKERENECKRVRSTTANAEWAHGATVLVEGLCPGAMQVAGDLRSADARAEVLRLRLEVEQLRRAVQLHVGPRRAQRGRSFSREGAAAA